MQSPSLTGERPTATAPWTVGVLLFDDVEVLDFAGPFEVFSRTRLLPGVDSRRSDESAPFRVFTVGRKRDAITATGGLVVVPNHSFTDTPRIDLLVVPGGFGTRGLLNDAETLDWIRWAAGGARLVTSVCTGALLLAQAGLLADRRATTHWGALLLLDSLGKACAWNARSAWSTTGSSARPAWRRAWTWPSTWSRSCAGARSPTRPRSTSSIGARPDADIDLRAGSAGRRASRHTAPARGASDLSGTGQVVRQAGPRLFGIRLCGLEGDGRARVQAFVERGV